MDKHTSQLQAVLYAHGGEVRKKEVSRMLSLSDEQLEAAVASLSDSLDDSGFDLIVTSTTLSLRSAHKHADLLADIHKKDVTKDIGTAGLEVLAIVLYKGEVARATIDYIRGVNSSGTIRQLLLRGLLERTRSTEDARAWLYKATPELLAHISVSSSKELPEYETLHVALTEPPTEHITHEHDTSITDE